MRVLLNKNLVKIKIIYTINHTIYAVGWGYTENSRNQGYNRIERIQ